MNGTTDGVVFGHVTPVIPATDVAASVAFYVERLGFVEAFRVGDPVDYAGIYRGDASIHVFRCGDNKVAEWTAFRIRVRGIDDLYAMCAVASIVHPNAPLAKKPWGSREFAVIDPAGVCITFWE